MASFKRLFRFEQTSGLLMIAAMVLSLAAANSPLAPIYMIVHHTPVHVRFGPLVIDEPLVRWVNEGLMAVFFLLVGLEIKRQLMEGHLSTAKCAALPALAALGGMLVPAAIYAGLNWPDPVAVRGWAIPTATDIVLALGVLSLLGTGVPVALKVFLTALAIFDDIGAVLIIALFYGEDLMPGPLAAAGLSVIGLIGLNVVGVRRGVAYGALGLVLWIAMLKSGIQAALAGVVIGAVVPLRAAECGSRVAGSAFRVSTDKRSEAKEILRGSPGILGIQRRAGELRFVVRPETGLAPDLKDRLSRLGPIEPVPPTMEDAFLVLRARAGGSTRDLAPDSFGPGPGHPRRDEPAVQTHRLTRRFDGFVAVDAVSLEVRPGQIFGLLGANGAGKTTLIRMLCGLLPPSDGRGQVAGIDIASQPRRLRTQIGYMSQRFSLYPDLTAAENMAFFAHAYGLGRRSRRAAIDWARAMTGLEVPVDRPAGRLSGAVRQRLALACSILHRPAVLFLDEPTSGVDPEARLRFWRLIDSLAVAGTTVLVTTHYLAEAAFCHRLAFMHAGRFIASGGLASLRAGLGAAAPDSAEDIFLAYIRREQEGAIRLTGSRL